MPIIDKQSGRVLCTTAQAADEFGCSANHIRKLARAGHLWTLVESPRVVFYDLREVRRLAKEHEAKRAKRGGRPPNGNRAA